MSLLGKSPPTETFQKEGTLLFLKIVDLNFKI